MHLESLNNISSSLVNSSPLLPNRFASWAGEAIGLISTWIVHLNISPYLDSLTSTEMIPLCGLDLVGSVIDADTAHITLKTSLV